MLVTGTMVAGGRARPEGLDHRRCERWRTVSAVSDGYLIHRISAIGVPINGAIADAIGLQRSLMTHVILVIITDGIAWFLPREDEVERYAVAYTPAT